MSDESMAADALAGLAGGKESNNSDANPGTRRSSRKHAKKMDSSDEEEPPCQTKKKKVSPKQGKVTEAEKELKKRLKLAVQEVKQLKNDNDILLSELDEKNDLIKAQGHSLSKYKQLCSSNGVTDLRKQLEASEKRAKQLETKVATLYSKLSGKDKVVKEADKWKSKYYESQDSLGKAQVQVKGLEAQVKVYESTQKKQTAVSVVKAKAAATGSNQRKLKQLATQLQKKKELDKEERQEKKKKAAVAERSQSIAFLSQ